MLLGQLFVAFLHGELCKDICTTWSNRCFANLGLLIFVEMSSRLMSTFLTLFLYFQMTRFISHFVIWQYLDDLPNENISFYFNSTFCTCNSKILWLHELWRFPYYINKPSLVPIGLQLFKWGHFHIFSLSYNLTSDDLWPWYMTFDLTNKWGFLCCIYDPTLVEIHQSMWKSEPNVNPFSQQQQQTTDNNNSGQSDSYVSFLLRQATQKLIWNK